jgi:hypothetical protein
VRMNARPNRGTMNECCTPPNQAVLISSPRLERVGQGVVPPRNWRPSSRRLVSSCVVTSSPAKNIIQGEIVPGEAEIR